MQARVREKGELAQLALRVARRTVEIGYPKWDWGEAVAWHGVAEAGIRLKDRSLLDSARAWLDSHADVRPTQLREVIPGLVATSVYEATKEPLALDLAGRVVKLLESQPRSVHGVYQDSVDIPVWVDYWYEITPFLTSMARITGETRFTGWAVEQSFAFIHSSWDAAGSLFHHAYYDINRRNSQWFWARANGWAALAGVEMLTDLASVPGVPEILLNILRRHIARVQELQDESGLWHTVLDQPSTYLEVSASVMLALAIKRGVRRGYLDAGLEAVADRGFEACVKYIDAGGNVNQVSGETHPGDIAHYKRIPLGVYSWGQGFTILALLEWLGEN
ncbi:hypothetical protein EPN29_11250 [bacterium]|nr:MAG: hypothetical protein EPN29_11250 [bacterium]